MGPGAADIAEVVSEVRDKLPGLEPPPALPPEQARFRLFDSTTTFLTNAAQSQPLMLVLDDLHWADKPSLLLLQFLARQLTESYLLVVGCYRDLELSRQHPLSATLAQLSRLPVFQRELLLGISQEDTGQFIEMTTGIRLSPQLVETIHAHTEGNPFFLKEMTRLLSERGELRAAEVGGPRGIRIPQGVREAIGQRLNRLSESCHRTLTIASIIGREFDFRLLRTLNDETTDEPLLGVIDEALAARLVEELPGGREHYCFSHALIQQTLAEELSASRKVRWHARIGEALEELYGVDGEVHAAEILHHLAEAVPISNSGMLVKYSLIAGGQALTAYAYEDAVDYFQQGLAVKKDDVSSNVSEKVFDAETAAILFGLGKAQGATGLVHEAWASHQRAFEFYLENRDVKRTVEIAQYPLFFVPGLRDTTRMASQALTLVQPGSLEAGRLLARYGMLLNLETGDYNRSQEALEKALLIAQREGDVLLEIQALTNAADVDWYHTRWEQVISKCERAIQLARSVKNLDAEVWPHYLAATSYWYSTPGQKAAEHIGAVLELSEKVRNRGFLSNALTLNASLAQCKGEWEAAREVLERCLDLSPDFFYPLSRRVALEFEMGDFEQGEVYLEHLLELMRKTPPGPVAEYAIIPSTVAYAAYVSGDFSRFNIAREAAEIVLSSLGVTLMVAFVTYIGLAFMAVLENDQESARKQYDNLKSLNMIFMDAMNTSLHRLLGLLARTFGQPQTASVHFEDALELSREVGYRPELAWTCYNYAEALLQHGQPGGHARAMPLLDEASSIACELGMRPLMERIQSLQEKLAVLPGSAPIYPDGLSQREVEVLRLIAAGKSNQEIADELVISPSTVAQHVRNILNKTSASNRTEAAGYAFRHNLMEG
jgi:DNA-binding CsgD family transcriptional regulator/tetratricopeptide (TPR) repeat protein